MTTDAYDPQLVQLATAGHDAAFEQGRQRAVELLETTDIAGFWLQTVGYGTLQDASPRDAAELRLEHQPTHLAGYADALEFPQVAAIARQLCGHHIGLWRVPHVRTDLDAFCTEMVEGLLPYAKQLDARIPDTYQYPDVTPLNRRVSQAKRLLESDALTHAWLQVLLDSDAARTLVSVGPDATGEWTVDHSPALEVEYLTCIPKAMPIEQSQQLTNEQLVQHLVVGARTTGLDLDVFAEHVADAMLETGGLHDQITAI
ncbi:hypothetical protein [Halorarius litoreus]|uniref:hypothetical protein n=1 Tax=Halorarius litoreus TaxID=2962676 RepID=UPI0020CCACC1|nr:hypothetical protein [Halorarius litoreus]